MFAILGLGFLLGMQHALEADHVAAVSSIAARRDNVGDIVKHGLTWGLGHTLTLFVFAGAAIGVVASAFNDWHKTFWDNLDASIELHKIPKVIAINHRDCGAAKIAYGEAKVANPQLETETHRAALTEFRKQVNERQPRLAVETGLMGLDGKVEMFS